LSTGRGGRRQKTVLVGAVSVGLIAALGGEALSAVSRFTFRSVAMLWSAAAAAVAVRAMIRARRRTAREAPDTPHPPLDNADRVILAAVGALLLVVAVTALFSAPNNWDSLTYHLPRIAHWIQDRGLAHYPTAILRQLTLPPGAELLLAHLALLSGSDRLFPLLQWAAWAGGLAAVWSIAEKLGAGRSGRVAAVAFAATLPMAILQASSTQNDLVAGLWLLIFADRSLHLGERGGGPRDVVLAGGSLGLALATKATAYLFAAPFAAWLAIALARRERARALVPLAGVAALALAVNVGYFARNLALFGSPFGQSYGALNEMHSPASVASGIFRNAALHAAAPWPGWNRAVEDAIRTVHRVIGQDPDDRRTTWTSAEFRVPPGLRGAARPDADETFFLLLHEDSAGNPAHLALSAAAALATAVSWRRRPRLAAYWSAVAAAGLLFCFVLKWQPWNARLQLPLFLLAAPAVAAALSREDRPRQTRLASALLLAASLPWALGNATRPLLGEASVLSVPRRVQLFSARPGLEKPLESAARAVAALGCRRIAMEIGPDDPEFLLWETLGKGSGAPARLEHVEVRNASGILSSREPFSGFRPCAAVSLGPPSSAAPAGALFSEDSDGGRVTVRLPGEEPRP
jgi:hypothetical protein